MRQITFDGRLGKDAVVGTAKNGTQYLKFSVANNTFANGEEKTEWFDVTTFNDFIIKQKKDILKKGSYVIVTGGLESEVKTYNGKIFLNHSVVANEVNVPKLSSNTANSGPRVEVPTVPTPTVPLPEVNIPSVEERLNTTPSPAVAVAANNVVVDSDDDLPF
jgi:single-stranded DNA-binding protein